MEDDFEDELHNPFYSIDSSIFITDNMKEEYIRRLEQEFSIVPHRVINERKRINYVIRILIQVLCFMSFFDHKYIVLVVILLFFI